MEGGEKVKKKVLIIAITFVLLIGTTTAASAYKLPGDRKLPSNDCIKCHSTASRVNDTGPHGGYTTGTNKCAVCHTVHKASSASLLPGATVTAACNYCHDLTGTAAGPYNMTGITTAEVYGAHKVQGINGWTAVSSIPGGDAATGGATVINAAYQGKMSGSTFTCDSCHTPHAIVGTTVEPYLGESQVKKAMEDDDIKFFVSSRLLKNKPNGVTNPINQYGTAWCSSCHTGRDNMGGVYNHPVYYDGVAYSYLQDITYVNGSSPQKVKDQGYLRMYFMGDINQADSSDMKFTNKYYRMTSTEPLTGAARDTDGYLNYDSFKGKGPTCQQCHASARDVDKLFGGPGKPARFSFPHLSTNKALLVETGDDFCTNCHGLQLP